jgi:hypothetical protein
MEQIRTQLNTLFNSAGKHYEALSYINHRNPQGDRLDQNKAELAALQDLLTALAPFKEKLINLAKYDL